MLGSSDIPKKWAASARYVDTELPRPRWRLTLDYQFLPRLNAGIEINPSAEEINPRGNYRLFDEGKIRPLISLGTSSDRIGSPKGTQAFYVTFGKSIPEIPVAPYVSINYSTWDDGFNFPFGANIQLHRRWALMPMYDGHRSHLLLNYSASNWGVSAMWVWYERAGVALRLGF